MIIGDYIPDINEMKESIETKADGFNVYFQYHLFRGAPHDLMVLEALDADQKADVILLGSYAEKQNAMWLIQHLKTIAPAAQVIVCPNSTSKDITGENMPRIYSKDRVVSLLFREIDREEGVAENPSKEI